MKIHEHYYNEGNRRLYIEFSTKSDGDDYYRVLDLDYEDIEYYSPDIINEYDLIKINKNFIIDLINQYLTENDLPEEQRL